MTAQTPATFPLGRLLLIVAAILFILAAISAAGAKIGPGAEVFALIAFACWVAAGAV